MTIPPSSTAVTDQSKSEAATSGDKQQSKYDPTADSSAQKKSDMVQRQINRSKLTRSNMSARRDAGKRYAMFEQEFGDVFEKVYSERQKEAAAAEDSELLFEEEVGEGQAAEKDSKV